LLRLGRYRAAASELGRGCDIPAFVEGEDTADVAWCEVSLATALTRLHRDAAALAKLDHAITVLTRSYGESHPQLGHALSTRGAAYTALGRHREARADLDRAIAILEHAELEPGYLATARWRRGVELWPDQRPRARADLAAARELFGTANGRWGQDRADAAAWLAAHERAKRRR
jgi:tetratricopeptide (TPR) repeat protein